MNPQYHYTYNNGKQFVSYGNPLLLLVALKIKDSKTEMPKLIGIWRFKKLTNKNK
jgi:hypothetical protein